jgi:hypothetical protein
MKYKNPCRLTLATVLVGMMVALPAMATTGNTRIVSPEHQWLYGALAQRWVQWAMGIGVGENPLNDETGAFCNVGQRGLVWNLAGTQGSSQIGDPPTTFRSCTVPSGRFVFFPILNVWYAKTDPAEPEDPDEIYDMMLSWLTADFYCEIDGQPVSNPEDYLTLSPIFRLRLPADSLWAAYGVPQGVYHPAATAGYYLLLCPLSPGEHSIRIAVKDEWVDDDTGETWSWGFDVIYDLTVQRPRWRWR